jgi:hypothetical protein
MAAEPRATTSETLATSRAELRELLRAAVVEFERHLATLERASRFMLLHKPGAADGDPMYDALIAAEVLMQLEIRRRRERLEEHEKIWSMLPVVL